MYKKSKYFISFYDGESKKYLYYNFLSEVLIAANKLQSKNLDEILLTPDNKWSRQNKYFKNLEEEGFILNENVDETQILKEQYNESLNKDSISISLSPTIDCNFSCNYCYQKREKSYMSKTFGDIVINHINNLKNNNTININWIGGEPLLNFEIIKYISERIQKDYYSCIFTNGYLIDRYINEFENLHIKLIYLTIDGSPERHNSIRYTENDKNTFEKILSNICDVVKKFPQIKIIIKMNIAKNESFNIKKIFSAFKNLKNKVYLNPGCIINKNLSAENNYINRGNQYIDYAAIFYRKLLENGFATYKLPRRKITGGCPAFCKDSIAISSNGIVHKCIEGIGTKNFIIGKVNINGKRIEIEEDKIEKYTNFDLFESKTCVDCKIFPYCMGGCLNEQIIKKEINYNKCRDKKHKIQRVKSMISEYFNNYQ